MFELLINKVIGEDWWEQYTGVQEEISANYVRNQLKTFPENESFLTNSSNSFELIGFLEMYSLINPPNDKMTITIEITNNTTTGVNKLSERI